MRRTLWPLLAVLVPLAAPTTAGADTVIASERAPSKISAELNRVVWSSYDPAAGDYHLMSRETLGGVTRLPVSPRKVPFDVDLGYLGEGIEVATYSRCKQEPSITGGGSGGLLPSWATGRGCDIYLYDFNERREVKYRLTAGGHASEFLPTVSPGGVAFARVYERRRGRRGKLPYLYARRDRLRRLPGGPRGLTGLPGPTSLDLSVPRLAFAWDWAPRNRGIGASTVRVDGVSGSHRTLESILSGLVGRTLFSPSIVGRDVLWGRTVVGENGDRSGFRYRAASRRAILSAPSATFLISTAGAPARGGIYYMTTKSMARAGSGPPACASSPAGEFPAACTIAQTSPLTFTREGR